MTCLFIHIFWSEVKISTVKMIFEHHSYSDKSTFKDVRILTKLNVHKVASLNRIFDKCRTSCNY
jgi:hypothetical protein